MKKLISLLLLVSLTACNEGGDNSSSSIDSQPISSSIVFTKKARYSSPRSMSEDTVTLGHKENEKLGYVAKLVHADYEDTIVYVTGTNAFLFKYNGTDFDDVTPSDISSLLTVSSSQGSGDNMRVDIVLKDGVDFSQGVWANYISTSDMLQDSDDDLFSGVVDLITLDDDSKLYDSIVTDL